MWLRLLEGGKGGLCVPAQMVTSAPRAMSVLPRQEAFGRLEVLF